MCELGLNAIASVLMIGLTSGCKVALVSAWTGKLLKGAESIEKGFSLAATGNYLKSRPNEGYVILTSSDLTGLSY